MIGISDLSYYARDCVRLRFTFVRGTLAYESVNPKNQVFGLCARLFLSHRPRSKLEVMVETREDWCALRQKKGTARKLTNSKNVIPRLPQSCGKIKNGKALRMKRL